MATPRWSPHFDRDEAANPGAAAVPDGPAPRAPRGGGNVDSGGSPEGEPSTVPGGGGGGGGGGGAGTAVPAAASPGSWDQASGPAGAGEGASGSSAPGTPEPGGMGTPLRKAAACGPVNIVLGPAPASPSWRARAARSADRSSIFSASSYRYTRGLPPCSTVPVGMGGAGLRPQRRSRSTSSTRLGAKVDDGSSRT